MKRTLAWAVLMTLAVVGALVAGLALRRDLRFQGLVARGNHALSTDQAVAAIEAFSGAIALKGDSMVAHLRRGEAYRKRGEIEAAGVTFNRDEPGGGIIGAAGLMLGLSAQRGIDAVCLMGETSGYIVDPMAAASVLAVLSKLAGVPVDPTKLNDRAAEMEKAIESMVEDGKSKDEELNYIG